MRASRLLALASASLLFACPKPEAEPAPAPAKMLADASAVADVRTAPTSTASTPGPGAVSTAPTGTWAEASSVDATVINEAIADLSKWVDRGAKDPKNAWAMAHALLAFGKDAQTEDGRKLIDGIVHDFAEAQEIDGKKLVLFPRKSADGQVAEVHKQLMIKSMIEAGVPMDRSFTLRDGGKVTMETLVRSAAYTAKIPGDPKEWRDFAWTAGALLQASRQIKGLFADNPSGLTEAKLAQTILGYTVQEQSFLEPFMKQDRPDLVQKRKQHIFAHQCGGLHVVQAGLQGALTLGDKASKRLADKQLELVRFRHRAERTIYEDMLAKAPQYEILLLVQELKFHGHVLETLALAHRQGLLERTPEVDRSVALVVADLFSTLKRLAPHYGKLTEIRKIREQTYLDMIGDGCHAIRGLREASVAFFAPS